LRARVFWLFSPRARLEHGPDPASSADFNRQSFRLEASAELAPGGLCPPPSSEFFGVALPLAMVRGAASFPRQGEVSVVKAASIRPGLHRIPLRPQAAAIQPLASRRVINLVSPGSREAPAARRVSAAPVETAIDTLLGLPIRRSFIALVRLATILLVAPGSEEMRAAFPILAIVREDSIRQASSVPNDAGRAEEVRGQMPSKRDRISRQSAFNCVTRSRSSSSRLGIKLMRRCSYCSLASWNNHSNSCLG
jgi:hypothetical protein